MAKRLPQPRRLMAIALLLVSVAAAADLLAQSQANPGPLTFEVTSVKPTLSPAEAGREAGRAAASGAPMPLPPAIPFGIRTFPGGRFTANTTVLALIARSYDVKEYQVDGGPKWIREDYFVIDARAGRDATAAEFNEMVKALLADRFGFRAHPSTRPGKVYSLLLARPDRKLGSALKPTPPECVAQIEERKRTAAASPPPTSPAPPPPPPASRNQASGPPDMTPRCGTTRSMMSLAGGGVMTLSVSGQPISLLVERLASDLSATVVDRTGLEGLFDFLIEFEAPRFPGIPELNRGGLDPNGTDSPKPPLRNAIEGQLGLKLEATEGQVPILVIDAAERPTAD